MSHKLQANKLKELSVKTMMQTVRVYFKDSLQADKDDIAKQLIQAINKSRDYMRKETPFYLFHGGTRTLH